MSKASTKAAIDSRKANIAAKRAEIAQWRVRKAQYKDKTNKAYCAAHIVSLQGTIAFYQREIASLRERMKYEK